MIKTIPLLLILVVMAMSLFPNKAHAASMIDLKADCGAAGDGTTDDSGALKTCINMVNASYAQQKATYIHVPAGFYLIKNTNGTMPSFAVGVPGAVVGDGPNISAIWLDIGYAGDLFSWSGATSTTDFPGNTVDPRTNLNGPLVSGLSISGNTGAAAPQNALMFYDHDDALDIQDVTFYSLPGYCISIGKTKNDTTASVRESFFKNIKCWNAGTTTSAAIEIGSTTDATSDGTNELNFYKIDIFNPKSTGIAITNKNQWNATRLIKFFGLRIEDSVYPPTGVATGCDGIDIGTSLDDGIVQSIDIYDLDEPVINANCYGVKVTNRSTNVDYQINIHALEINGPGKGIYLKNIFYSNIDASISTVGTSVTLASYIGSGLSIVGANGSQPGEWTWDYSAATTDYGLIFNNVHTPIKVFGIPNAAVDIGEAAMQRTITGTSPLRLTMDGKAVNNQNCFNPTYAQQFNLMIQLIAVDTTNSANNYSWTMPVAYFAADGGAGSATFSGGTPTIITNGSVTGAAVGISADTTHGCLNLTFRPPTGNTDTWKATARIHFARVSD